MILGIQLYGLLEKGNVNEKELLTSLREVGINMAEPCIDFAKVGEEGNPAFWSVGKFEALYPEMIPISVAAVWTAIW